MYRTVASPNGEQPKRKGVSAPLVSPIGFLTIAYPVWLRVRVIYARHVTHPWQRLLRRKIVLTLFPHSIFLLYPHPHSSERIHCMPAIYINGEFSSFVKSLPSFQSFLTKTGYSLASTLADKGETWIKKDERITIIYR